MSHDPDADPQTSAFAELARRLGGRLLDRRPLTGGVSADVQVLGLVRPGGAVERLVVRRHALEGPSAVAPGTTAAEFRLLGALADRGLPVPRPRLLDETCDLLPGPFMVLPFVEGTTEIAPDALPAALDQLADFCARLHRLDPAEVAPATLPERRDPVPGALEYLPRTAALSAARRRLEAGPVRPLASTSAVLHGDLWPGNLLWRGGRLAAVIDWEDAAVGDPLADVAGCRVELSWSLGPEAGAGFVQRYAAARGAPVDDVALAMWELYVASAGLTFMPGWGLAPALEARIRRSSTRCITDAARRVVAAR